MGTLEKYYNELEESIKIDEFTIKDVQMKLPGIRHLYIGRLIRHKKRLNQLNGEKDKLKNTIASKIQDEGTIKVSRVAAIKTAEKSELVNKLNQEIKEEELVILFLDKAEKNLSQINFDVRNIVEIMKLETT